MVKLFKSLVRPYVEWPSHCSLVIALREKKNADLKSAKKSLRCYLNLLAQSMKKHWSELICVPWYELTCHSGTSWLGWVRVDLGTTWADTCVTPMVLYTKVYDQCDKLVSVISQTTQQHLQHSEAKKQNNRLRIRIIAMNQKHTWTACIWTTCPGSHVKLEWLGVDPTTFY